MYKVFLLFIFLAFSFSACAEEAPKEIIFEVPVLLKIVSAEASSFQPPNVEKKENFFSKNVIDGNPNTRWSSEFKEPQWLIVDLGEIYDVVKVVISWESAYAVSYKIELSVDGKALNEVYSTDTGDGKIDVITFPLQKARYIRISCLKRKSNFWGFSIWDVSVYGKRKLVLF